MWYCETMRVIIILGFISVFIALSLFTNMFRMFKSVLLILQVDSYEQTVIGNKAILVIGDSTGYGTGAGDARFSIAGLMGKDFPLYSIINNSSNGRTIPQAITVLKQVPEDAQYDLILLQIGANDILQKRDPGIVRTELISLYTEAKKHSQNVVMLSNGNIGASYAFKGKEAETYTELSREFRIVYMEAADVNGVHYVDLFEEPEDDVFVSDPKKYTAFDGLHPSAQGYMVWYKKLEPVLRELLR